MSVRTGIRIRPLPGRLKASLVSSTRRAVALTRSASIEALSLPARDWPNT